jgi:hypothetical protein
MSSRLGTFKLLEMEGGHDVLFTRPEELADKLIEAIRTDDIRHVE